MAFVFIAAILVMAIIIGTTRERRHLGSLDEREAPSGELPAVASGQVEDRPVVAVRLVTGSVVVSSDAYKRLLGQAYSMLGGNMPEYEIMLERARREAVQRMRENGRGADIIVNVRLETSTLDVNANHDGGIGCVEVLAYGTALTFATPS